MIMHTDNIEAARPLSNDERRAAWASQYYMIGQHRMPLDTKASLWDHRGLPDLSPDELEKWERECGEGCTA